MAVYENVLILCMYSVLRFQAESSAKSDCARHCLVQQGLFLTALHARMDWSFFAVDESKSYILHEQIRSVLGRGRYFIRVALCHKVISVPIEHLARNARLTQV